MNTAYITHPDCLQHDMGQEHPEQPARLSAIHDALHEAQLMDFLSHYEAPLGTDEQILLAHSQQHLDFIKQRSPASGVIEIDPDTSMNPHTLRAAYRAVGATTFGVDLLLKKEVKSVFCAIRPPGHHAEKEKAMGFCFFNNLAIAAKYALENYGVKKLAVLDFDVHHGNGTESILVSDSRVLVCSSFQHPFYPNNNLITQSPNIICTPLVAGSGTQEFREAIIDSWMPALNTFEPELILISAGFDAHQDDPLAELNLTEQDFAWITDQVRSVANKYAQGRILSALEGGYALPALGRSVVAHIRSLMIEV